jgi:hypothetical protein
MRSFKINDLTCKNSKTFEANKVIRREKINIQNIKMNVKNFVLMTKNGKNTWISESNGKRVPNARKRSPIGRLKYLGIDSELFT